MKSDATGLGSPAEQASTGIKRHAARLLGKPVGTPGTSVCPQMRGGGKRFGRHVGPAHSVVVGDSRSATLLRGMRRAAHRLVGRVSGADAIARDSLRGGRSVGPGGCLRRCQPMAGFSIAYSATANGFEQSRGIGVAAPEGVERSAENDSPRQGRRMGIDARLGTAGRPGCSQPTRTACHVRVPQEAGGRRLRQVGTE